MNTNKLTTEQTFLLMVISDHINGKVTDIRDDIDIPKLAQAVSAQQVSDIVF